jgi:hypothetical protein
MSKRNKQQAPSVTHGSNGGDPALATRTYPTAIHPPAKQPTLLAVSIALFALWFMFLLVTAILG